MATIAFRINRTFFFFLLAVILACVFCLGIFEGMAGAQDLPGTVAPCEKTCPKPSPKLRPFDLGAHGLDLSVRGVVVDGVLVRLLVYEPRLHVAALIETSTGYAQIAQNFTAGLGVDERGPITFDGVSVLSTGTFGWWHRGAVWTHQWDTKLPWTDLKTLKVYDPAVGAEVPLFRWR